MKSKFVLTEEESKRILSLHTQKINDEKINLTESKEGGELNRKDKTVKLVKKIPLVGTNLDNRIDYNDQLALIAGAVFKPTSKGNIAATVEVESSETGRRENKYVVYYCYPNQVRRDKNSVRKFQVGKKLYVPSGGFANSIKTSAWDDLCAGLKYTQGGGEGSTPSPTPSKKGCPSIVKSFTDAGFTQITLERYKELASDNTRIRKYKYCPVTKKNLFFAKMKQSSGGSNTGGGTTPPIGGGGSTGEQYPFDYDTILKAFPGEDIVNPFEQGGEEPKLIVVTDKMYGEL